MAVARHNGGNIRDSVLIMFVLFLAGAGIFYVRLVCGGKMLAQRVELLNVRYWHLADIPLCTAHVRFWV
jgi:hypothetical protein